MSNPGVQQPDSPLRMLLLEGEYLRQNCTQVPEKELQSWVEYFATACGWTWYHTWRSVRSPSGFPDLVLIRPPKCLFVELKRMGKAATIAQQAWLDGLSACGLDARLWTPADVTEIVETLSRDVT